MTYLNTHLSEEPFTAQAIDFLKQNEEAENIILVVFKNKKMMQLPRELVWGGVVDTVTSASLVKHKDDFVEHLGVLIKKHLQLEDDTATLKQEDELKSDA